MADLMTPQAVITAVPVVDDDERPVGVVSEADLLRGQMAKESASTAEGVP